MDRHHTDEDEPGSTEMMGRVETIY
jgi:hypothetical protein